MPTTAIGQSDRAKVRRNTVRRNTVRRNVTALTLASALCLFGAPSTPRMANAQQPIPPPWQSDGEVRRRIEPPATPPAGEPANPWAPATQAPPPRPQAAAPANQAKVALSAYLTQDGELIDQGLVWRVYSEPAPTEPPLPRLLGTWKDPAPVVSLDPGRYLVNVAFGRAHLTRRIAVPGPAKLDERFVLNAGGLRITAVLGTSEKIEDQSVSYDIHQGDADQLGGRTKVAVNLRPGLIVRLNAGLYHLVSTLGDTNAAVNADVTVEAGKLTDAVISHHAARVTFKLVNRAGGEAQADTQWAVHNEQGDLIRETQGALPSHILAAGSYVANARHAGRLYQRQFTVTSGEPAQVEVVMQ